MFCLFCNWLQRQHGDTPSHLIIVANVAVLSVLFGLQGLKRGEDVALSPWLAGVSDRVGLICLIYGETWVNPKMKPEEGLRVHRSVEKRC